MRALSSLTLRGRAFLAAGITAVGCAIVLGQPALVRIGILVAALPLVAVLVVGRKRPEPRVARSLWPPLMRAGETAHIDLVITSEDGRGALLVEDTLPYALGTRPRFVLHGLRSARRRGAGWQRTLTYPVRSDLRGRYAVGPLSVRTIDPFGLVERHHTLGGTAEVLVTPHVLALPPIPLAGGWQGAGEHRPRAFASGSAEDTSVREYRRGDDLRRVHWRSSARIGELMVRREEQPWEAHATVLLDNRDRAHRGQGAASSFESAVIAAASIVVHLEEHGYAVQLVTATGPTASGAADALHQLGVVGLTPATTLDVVWSGDQARGGVVVAVLGSITDDDTASLRRIRHDAGAALGVVIDVEQWSPTRVSGGADAASAPLLALGWRATGVGPRDRLDQAWRDLGRAPSRRGASA